MPVIDELFTRLKQDGQTAFMPFVTAGDPNVEFSESLLLALST